MIRFFDILFSSLGLFFLFPLFVIIITLLKFSGEGEIFYFQKRVGVDRKIFGLFKFATMLKNSEKIGTKTLTIKNDPRILPMGSFLRKTKINELPQLINVLKGDMSLIGPRPLTPDTFEKYSCKVKNTISKHRPGLSGVGSIIFRNEEEIVTNTNDASSFYFDVIAPYKGELEIWYCKKINIFFYFHLILLTLLVVLLPNKNFHKIFLRDLPEPDESLKRILNL
jgi:lipopolysaccharide/colanic/teichoic acid biosynthesis glycosyltransferase|tara:strand:- start:190 stop:861 length:672 start_codon:yes stop_codon:yes gene_type:complete